jgi:hypothetical protein
LNNKRSSYGLGGVAGVEGLGVDGVVRGAEDDGAAPPALTGFAASYSEITCCVMSTVGADQNTLVCCEPTSRTTA